MGLFFNRKKAKAQVDDGSKAYRRGRDALDENKDYEEAFRAFSESAEKGYNNGIYCLAECYEWGRGTTKDLDKARQLYEECLGKQNETGAQVGLYRIFSNPNYSGYDAKKARAYLDPAIAREKTSGKYGYGAHYELGKIYWAEGRRKEAFDIVDCVFDPFKGTSAIAPEMIIQDLRLKKLPPTDFVWLNLAGHGNTKAAEIAMGNFFKNGLYAIARDKRLYEGVVKSPMARYYLAKCEYGLSVVYQCDEEKRSECLGDLFCHYLALLHRDIIPATEIMNKYREEYDRLFQRRIQEVLDDLEILGKVYDRDYYIKATVDAGCTICGMCLDSKAFGLVDGMVRAKNTTIHIENLIGDASKVKHEVVCCARECPAQCIQYEFCKEN